MLEPLKEQLQLLVAELLQGTDKELVEILIRRQSRRIVIEVLVDKVQRGITLDECAFLNRKIAEQIEIKNLIADSYVVEVSSPGLDRPLQTQRDFQRNRGCRIHVYLSEAIDLKLEYEGVISEAFPDRIVIEEQNKKVEIPLVQIRKAIQIF
jgi:ribosome maturation factor RimP